MRENRTSGSEGMEFETNRTSLPLFIRRFAPVTSCRFRDTGCKQPVPPSILESTGVTRETSQRSSQGPSHDAEIPDRPPGHFA